MAAFHHSEVGIASAANIHLGRDPIADWGDLESTDARIYQERYPAVRDALLRSYPWNFAMEFASLAGSELSTSQFGFTHKCALPAGGDLPWCLRLWRVQEGVTYAVRGRFLFTTAKPPVNISYVGRVENPEMFDALFLELVALDLAMAVINRIPTNEVRKRTREMQTARSNLRREARMTDAMEQSAGKVGTGNGQGSWLDVRRPG